ncbi:hypothetical protein [Hyphomonas sp.]|uniref:hypothetical protein n=1 Tax=Hyphomonas sp. TaxID=87 RepID=UPI003918DDFD
MAMPRLKLTTSALLVAAALLAACSSSGENLGEMRPELGDFRLCYNIVTTNDAVKGPLSRDADVEVIAEALRDEIDRRFSRYEGTRLYHIALHLDAYVLAMPGIPLVMSPRSVLIVSANVWDDQLGRPLNEAPKQLTVLESAGAGQVLGSGLTMDSDQQLTMLAQNTALAVEGWLLENPDWFIHPEDPAEAPETTGPTPRVESDTVDIAAAGAPEGAAAGPVCGRR